MTTTSFLSSISYHRDTSIDEKIISSLSDYFYLGGVQVKVVKGNEVRLEEGKVSWFTLALKVASYVLLLPLTCILFAIYQSLRSQYNFTPVALPKPDTTPRVGKKPEQEEQIELTVTLKPSKEVELPKSVQPEPVKPNNKATSSTSASSAYNSQNPLLTQGKFRLSQDQNEPPNFTSICDVIASEMLWSAAFACCFHTSESFNEIWALIKKCNINERNKIQSSHPMFALPPRTEINEESCVRFYNNLCHLHDNMPGDTKLKSAKIYWNDRVEEILFPLFFNDNVNIDDLIFIITPGEGFISIDQGNTPGKAPYPYQAEKMVFTRQLQFVGTGKAKIFECLKNDIEILAKQVQGATIKAKEQVTEETNALMADAEYYTYLCNLHSELLAKL
jgi:hypothetical protein